MLSADVLCYVEQRRHQLEVDAWSVDVPFALNYKETFRPTIHTGCVRLIFWLAFKQSVISTHFDQDIDMREWVAGCVRSCWVETLNSEQRQAGRITSRQRQWLTASSHVRVGAAYCTDTRLWCLERAASDACCRIDCCHYDRVQKYTQMRSVLQM